VVVRRATYDLAQAEARAHLLEGFVIALDHLDEVIAVIRAPRTPRGAHGADGRFSLSERQANAILEMRLRSLTAMERQRVIDELAEVRAKIDDLKALLASDERIARSWSRSSPRSASSTATSAAPSSRPRSRV
jgi:DNA gyrase subunit A